MLEAGAYKRSSCCGGCAFRWGVFCRVAPAFLLANNRAIAEPPTDTTSLTQVGQQAGCRSSDDLDPYEVGPIDVHGE